MSTLLKSTLLRRFAILAGLAIIALLLTQTLYATGSGAARPQAGTPEALLLDAANRDRAAAGLPALHWDNSLAASARQHAQLMAQKRALSHQFPGELAMQDRARQNGAHFSLIAENVAEGPSVAGLHAQWMNSPHHRANILDSEMNAVGIAIVQSGNLLFAVEDFSLAIAPLSIEQQEKQVESLLISQGAPAVSVTADARKTCGWDHGVAGPKPLWLIRFEATDLSQLPDEVEQKLQSAKYGKAAVGACDIGGAAGFRIAIMLFP